MAEQETYLEWIDKAKAAVTDPDSTLADIDVAMLENIARLSLVISDSDPGSRAAQDIMDLAEWLEATSVPVAIPGAERPATVREWWPGDHQTPPLGVKSWAIDGRTVMLFFSKDADGRMETGNRAYWLVPATPLPDFVKELLVVAIPAWEASARWVDMSSERKLAPEPAAVDEPAVTPIPGEPAAAKPPPVTQEPLSNFPPGADRGLA